MKTHIVIVLFLSSGCAAGDLYSPPDAGALFLVSDAGINSTFEIYDNESHIDSGMLDAGFDSGDAMVIESDAEPDLPSFCAGTLTSPVEDARIILRDEAEYRATTLGCSLSLPGLVLPDWTDGDLVFLECCLAEIASAMDCQTIRQAVNSCDQYGTEGV